VLVAGIATVVLIALAVVHDSGVRLAAAAGGAPTAAGADAASVY
jgi:hypothetical protein